MKKLGEFIKKESQKRHKIRLRDSESLLLGIGGFDTDPTSASAIASINLACIWVPIVTSVIGGICIAMFNLDKYYDKITADLAAGKWKGSSDN